MKLLWLKHAALLLFFLSGTQARADLVGGVVTSPATVTVNQSITYTLSVTNTSVINAANVTITSQYPSAAVVVSAVNSPANAGVTTLITTNSGSVIFQLSQLPAGSSTVATLVLQPTAVGSFTNFFSAVASGFTTWNDFSVAPVTALNADLALTVTSLPAETLANDYITYTNVAGNSGPGVANGVTVTSILPTNVTVIAVSPAGRHSLVNRSLVYNVGTLTNGQSSQFYVTVQAGATGTNVFSQTVQSSDTTDAATANNTAVTSVSIAPYIPADIQILNLSTFVYNQSKSLFEQKVTFANVGSSNISNIHLIATDLNATNKLWTPSGTNAARPFLLVTNTLVPGETREATLQFFFAKRQPVPVAIVGAGIESTATIAPFTTTVTVGTDGNVVFQVPATIGRTYSVLYAENLADLIPPATNAIRTAPITATNRTVTLTAPPPPLPGGTTNTIGRFFQVIQNP